MTTVAILPVPTDTGIFYQGTAGDKHSLGRTLGEALDALTPQLPDVEAGLLVVIQGPGADQFFGAAQQQRLGELMAVPPCLQAKPGDEPASYMGCSTSRVSLRVLPRPRSNF